MDELNRQLELLLFEDDLTANSDSRMISALAGKVSAYNCGPGISVNVRQYLVPKWGTSSVIPFENPDRPGMHTLAYVYEKRIGQPWQASIEHHVVTYRAKPRRLADTPDGMMLVIEKLRSRAMTVRMHCFIDELRCSVGDSETFIGISLPEIVARAAIAALT